MMHSCKPQVDLEEVRRELAQHAPQLEILNEIGCGGEAIVYRGVRRGGPLADDRAIKVCPKLFRGDEYPEGFWEQYEAWREVGESNHVLQRYSITPLSNYIVIEQELGRGSLQSLLDEASSCGESGMSRKDCWAYFSDVARALQEAHDMGVLHGDVKPANMILVQTRSKEFAKLGDFGTAVVQRSNTTVWRRGYTPQYLLPLDASRRQQINGADTGFHPLTRERDLFALAVSYAQMRLGRLPFRDKDGLDGLPGQRIDLDGLDADEQELLMPVLRADVPSIDIYEWIKRLEPDLQDTLATTDAPISTATLVSPASVSAPEAHAVDSGRWKGLGAKASSAIYAFACSLILVAFVFPIYWENYDGFTVTIYKYTPEVLYFGFAIASWFCSAGLLLVFLRSLIVPTIQARFLALGISAVCLISPALFDDRYYFKYHPITVLNFEDGSSAQYVSVTHRVDELPRKAIFSVTRNGILHNTGVLDYVNLDDETLPIVRTLDGPELLPAVVRHEDILLLLDYSDGPRLGALVIGMFARQNGSNIFNRDPFNSFDLIGEFAEINRDDLEYVLWRADRLPRLGDWKGIVSDGARHRNATIRDFSVELTDHLVEALVKGRHAADAVTMCETLAWGMQEVEEYQRAIEAYTKTIELNSHYAPAYLQRGVLKVLQNKQEAAVVDFERATELDESWVKAYVEQSEKMRGGYQQRSQKLLKEALASELDSSRSTSTRTRFDEALEVLRRLEAASDAAREHQE